MKESFSKRMKEAMNIMNIKQVDLVEKTGLTKSAISQYYSGKYEPKQKGIFLIAKALDVSESWLMGYDVPMDRLLHEKLAEEVKLIEQIQVTYGEKAVQLLELFVELNATGKNKAVENLIDLSMLGKYTEK
jgi:transcriptional regulator with XRE-family HTH domain